MTSGFGASRRICCPRGGGEGVDLVFSLLIVTPVLVPLNHMKDCYCG